MGLVTNPVPIEQLLLTLRRQGIKIWVEQDKLHTQAAAGLLTAELAAQIRLYKNDLVDLLSTAQNNRIQSPIQPTTRSGNIPLSFAQERLWFMDALGNGVAYNLPIRLELVGALDRVALQQALCAIVRRHESLRTTFAVQDGAAQQVIHPARSIEVPMTDLRGWAAAAQQQEVQRLTAAEALKPFDLTRDCMLRAQLLQLAERSFVLLLTMHHIASDGWSIGVLERELAALYADYTAGKACSLAELPIQYADFALWQRNHEQEAQLERQLRWWQEQLADVPALLALPTDQPRPAQQSFRGAVVPFLIADELTQQLRQLSQEAGCTLYMTLLAAFYVLLYRYTAQERIAVGSPIANRDQQQLEGLIGLFVNTLVMPCNLAGNPTFRAVLKAVQQTTQTAYDHQGLPFERLVQALRPERTLSYNPLVQVMFALQNTTMGQFSLPGLQIKPMVFEIKFTRMDMEWHLLEEGERLKGYCIFATDLFEEATIQRMVGHFQRLLKGIVADPQQAIGSLPLLTDAEHHQLLVEWNATTTAYPKETCIHQRFEAQVERTPAAVAVIFDNQQVTYAELNARANQLAHHLQQLGVGPEVLVGVAVERSIEMVVALLGILKAGGAYVPLDPTYPAERLAFMLQDANTPVLLTQEHLLPQLPMTTAQVVCLDRDWPLIATQPSVTPVSHGQAEQLAYVIYTSGSTGTPKGVQVEIGSLANLCHWYQHFCAINSASTVLQLIPIGFDASIKNFLVPLLCGAKLVIPRRGSYDPEALCDLIPQYQVSVINCVPSAFYPLIEVTEKSNYFALRSLQYLAVGGEATDLTKLKSWLSSPHHHCTVANMYGPTECTDIAVAYQLPRHGRKLSQQLPIGKPINHMQVYLLDANHQPVPIGVPGELYIGGVQVGRGYLNRPELTKEKFIPTPFGDGRLYKTGDLARWLPDGNIEFLGRRDHQVKVRGFRIELGEIASCLRQHPAVQEAVVITKENNGDQQLVAYLVCHPQAPVSQPPPTPNGHAASEGTSPPLDYRNFLRRQLPEYMIPSAVVLLDALPLTPNGKVDHKALSALAASPFLPQTVYTPPSTPTEVDLAAIWSAILGLEQVSIHDSFFELGGHSLLATQVVSRIRNSFAIELPLRTLFEKNTIAQLAEAVDLRLLDYVDETELTELLNEIEGVPA